MRRTGCRDEQGVGAGLRAAPAAAWAALCGMLLAGCVASSSVSDIPSVTSASYALPELSGPPSPGQKEWLLLDARLLWFDADKLKGVNWTLSSVSGEGIVGLYYATVSGSRLTELLTRADGRLVPSEGSQGMGLMRSDRPAILCPVLATLPPGPKIELRLDCRGSIRREEPGSQMVIVVTASERTGETTVERRGLCRTVIGADEVLLIDGSQLLGRARQPALVVAVAVDQFEWKDSTLGRTFPWGTLRQTQIAGRRVKNIWALPQSKRR